MYGAKLMRQLGCFDSVYTLDSSEVRGAKKKCLEPRGGPLPSARSHFKL